MPTAVQRIGPSFGAPKELQRIAFGCPNQVMVDARRGRGHPQSIYLCAGIGVGPAIGVDVLDAQCQRVGESTARRRVRRRLHRVRGARCVQRVQQNRSRAVLGGGPVQEIPQIADVADAPRARRAQRVELKHPAPRRSRRRHLRRRGDQRRLLPVAGAQPVPPRFKVGGQLVAHRNLGAVLAHQCLGPRYRVTTPVDPNCDRGCDGARALPLARAWPAPPCGRLRLPPARRAVRARGSRHRRRPRPVLGARSGRWWRPRGRQPTGAGRRKPVSSALGFYTQAPFSQAGARIHRSAAR